MSSNEVKTPNTPVTNSPNHISQKIPLPCGCTPCGCNPTFKSDAKLEKEKKERKNDRIINALETLFSNGATTGAFFAGFTLNIVVSSDASEQLNVRLYSAICSLLFVLLVLMCSAGSVVLAYYREDVAEVMDGNRKLTNEEGWEKWHMWSTFGLLPTFLFTVVSGGIIFFFLIMKTYENAVGLAGLVAVGVGMLFGGIGWMGVLLRYYGRGEKNLPKTLSPMTVT